MKRRNFITLLGGAAAWPLVARAQQAKAATIGLLGTGGAAAQAQWTAAFVQRMRDLGWVEGRNLAIEYRWAEGRTERLNELASDLVRLKVDVIVTHNTPGPLAAKQATSTIPIVFATAGDPVGAGIVAKSRTPGRQRHRAVESKPRCCRQAPRPHARDHSWLAPIGGPSRYR